MHGLGFPALSGTSGNAAASHCAPPDTSGVPLAPPPASALTITLMPLNSTDSPIYNCTSLSITFPLLFHYEPDWNGGKKMVKRLKDTSER
ncbi:hypothetical protein GWI33_021560 [Rhynchophorus ferrugineus]|uniref:Uncharacterized protein n=1 Tax=Rhynchophorus ferrugineus TaxID=354439 RepID=A0A834J141_RHYFE|nr:hypothetical protein GWI33_021560 [Rhynchophorus ferrugineus]